MARPTADEIEAAYMRYRELQFWAQVDKRGPDECWEWEGLIDGHGYGTMCIHGKKQKAHRLACLFVGRPIPDHLLGMHKCDHKTCVNPDHIEGGTSGQNMQDAWDRGLMRPRGPAPHLRGENSATCKVSDADVAKLRTDYRNGVPLKQLAAEFNISYVYASKLNNYHFRAEVTHV